VLLFVDPFQSVMDESSPATTPRVVAAVSAGAVAVAASFAVAGSTPAFVGVPIASLVVDTSPGAVTTAAIAVLGDFAQVLAGGTAVLLTVLLFAAVAFGAATAGRRSRVTHTAGILGTAGAFVVAVGVTGAFVGSLAAAVSLGAVLVLAERRWGLGGATRYSRGRRRVLRALGGVGVASIAAYLVGRGKSGAPAADETVSIATVTDESVAMTVDETLARARDQSLSVPGIDPLVTDVEQFYRVDINVSDPNVSADAWRLAVTGDVDRPVTLSYEDLLGMELDHRFETLRCVGESLNGEKMDTALWTGVPVRDVLDRAGVPENCCVMLRAADGYYEEFPLSALRDGFLAVGMNGQVLPRAHGHPVRALVPGHWGEINVKWLTEIEVLREPATGYWEERGWHGTGPVETVAKLHAVNRLGDGRIQVGGHAYAGTRGIERVEVSVDGGVSWADATLSDPLPDPDTWRMWEHTYERDGEHEVIVRAYDGTGARQSSEQSRPFPSGPTGWVSRRVEP
jgi:DMSO/TMAO reductase YedYZ molybdopterin-dependent catalytic subunit